MSDQDQDIAKEFEEAFNNDDNQPTPEETPKETPETPESPESPKEEKEEEPEDKPEDKPDDGAEAPTPKIPEPAETPEKKEEQDDTEDQPKPLTEDSVRNIISELRNEERSSSKEIEEATNEVIEAYYPDGLSNTLIDEASGKELKTPSDVVEVSGGSMSIEEAAKWLLNEQYKLDKEVSDIKDKAKKIADTTLRFEKDSQTVLKKYEPLFKAYPSLQAKTWNAFQKQVQTDKNEKFILSAPDIAEFYDLVLDPYRMAYEHGQQQPATAPTPEEKPPEPPKPTAEDRLDITGDGGSSEPLDPNDFAGNVRAELAKGI